VYRKWKSRNGGDILVVFVDVQERFIIINTFFFNLRNERLHADAGFSIGK
jgi:hypothetical protein